MSLGLAERGEKTSALSLYKRKVGSAMALANPGEVEETVAERRKRVVITFADVGRSWAVTLLMSAGSQKVW